MARTCWLIAISRGKGDVMIAKRVGPKIAVASVLTLAVMCGLLLFWEEVPAWRWAGTDALPIALVAHDGGTDLCPPPGGTIELRGDSLVIARRMGSEPGENAPAYGKVLESRIGGKRRVLLNGRGGATSLDGAGIGAGTPIRADLLILAFGTNDAAPRAFLGKRKPVPVARFEAAIEQQVAAAKSAGSTVALSAPPPTGSAAMNTRIAPYREALERLAVRLDVTLLDPAAAFSSCDARQPLLVRDALHINARGHACIGEWLATEICGPGD